MEKKVWDYVNRFHMLEAGDRVIAGVSGGADSVCLFLLLLEFQKRIPFNLGVVHVEHGIRGQDALEDAAFVEKMCAQHGVAYEEVHADVPALAEQEGLSLEEAGRKARYDAFFCKMKEWKGTKIAVAHHRNDQAETVLMNILRGTGLKGLGGMEPVNGTLIRPLLCVARQEIEEWLDGKGAVYRTDTTNLEEIYTRNRIRHRLLPEAEQINVRALEHLTALSDTAREAEDYLWQMAGKAFAEYVSAQSSSKADQNADGAKSSCREVLVGNALVKEHPVIQKYVLKMALTVSRGGNEELKDIGAIHLEQLRQLLGGEVGKRTELPRGWYGRKTYEGLLIGYTGVTSGEIKQRHPAEIRFPRKEYFPQIPGIVILEDGRKLYFNILEYKKDQEIPRKRYTKWFDYDKIKGSLTLRTRKKGDFIIINDQGGRKKLKDYFIDEKIARDKRDDILLLADEAQVLWVPGYRSSEHARVTETSKRVLEITVVEFGEDTNEGGNNHE